jgi:hypothetical protein
MKPVALVVLTMLALSLMPTRPAQARDVSLVGHWIHCDPQKGCYKIAFFPSGATIAQFPVEGTTVTARGKYRLRDGVLKLRWHSASPKKVCVANAADPAGGQTCHRTRPHTMKGQVTFTGFNKLTWSTGSDAPMQLDRVQE